MTAASLTSHTSAAVDAGESAAHLLSKQAGQIHAYGNEMGGSGLGLLPEVPLLSLVLPSSTVTSSAATTDKMQSKPYPYHVLHFASTTVALALWPAECSAVHLKNFNACKNCSSPRIDPQESRVPPDPFRSIEQMQACLLDC